MTKIKLNIRILNIDGVQNAKCVYVCSVNK